MRSIRSYLALLVLGAILPGAITTSVLVWRAITTSRDAAMRRLLDSARVDARSLERHITSTLSVLGALATSPALDRGDLQAFHAEARRVQTTQPGWYTVMLLSSDEQQLVSSRLPWGTPLTPVTEAASLRRAVQTRSAVVGPIRKAPRGGNEFLFAVRLPVLQGEQVRYVLSAILDVASLSDIVPSPAPDSEEWTRTILDQEGTIAVRTRGGESFVGQPGTPAFLAQIRDMPEGVSRQRTLEGNPVYAATSRTRSQWTTVVAVPESALDRAPQVSMTGLLAGGALLMACGVGAVLMVTRRLTRDIETITAVGEAVAENRPLPDIDPELAETARLKRSLIATMGRLEEQGRAKDAFLAVLGHELRNPLAPALTALEIMKRRDPDVFRRERDVLERQVRHMVRLVDDLLDISRVARGKIEIQRARLDIGEVLRRSIDMVQPLIDSQQHTLTLRADTALYVEGDIDRLVQVVTNLLTNAARYTPPHGHITLTATGTDTNVVIACEDDGPGIAEALRHTLFEPFVQGTRSLDRREGGLGLGLALARVFVELHEGTIRAERPDAGGARVIVSLPRASAAPVARPESVATAAVEHRRLLLVDDNADAREMLRLSLSDVGHSVMSAEDGEQALAIARHWSPEVAILDIGLPGMSGYTLAAQLRLAHPGIRLIALTGYGQASDREAARDAGFHHHATKPVTIDELLKHIAT